MNFLASPPLVVAYALAGTLDLDLTTEPLGTGTDGKPVYLKDVWPSDRKSQELLRADRLEDVPAAATPAYSRAMRTGAASRCPPGKLYAWDAKSTYVKNPPYFEGMTRTPPTLSDITAPARSRCSATRSPPTTSRRRVTSPRPARRRATSIEQGVKPADFNSYGARRGNHEVMMRGTFANIRLRNLLAPGTEGGVTVHVPSGETDVASIDAAMRYKAGGTPLRDPRGPGVRHRLLARLGGQGHDAAGREGRHRRELRAHPPLESHRHGRAAAAVPARPERAEPRPHRQGDLRPSRG